MGRFVGSLTPSIHLEDLFEHPPHGLLDDLVFQRSNPQGSLPTSFRNPCPLRGLSPISPTLLPAREDLLYAPPDAADTPATSHHQRPAPLLDLIPNSGGTGLSVISARLA